MHDTTNINAQQASVQAECQFCLMKKVTVELQRHYIIMQFVRMIYERSI